MRPDFQKLINEISSGELPDEPGPEVDEVVRHIRNEQDSEGRTLPMYAELYGRPKLALHLLALGCDPRVQDNNGRDWYHYRAHLHGSEQRRLDLEKFERESDLQRLSNQFDLSIHSPNAKKIRL